MNTDPPEPPEDAPPDPGPFTQEIQHTPIGARVPESVSRGVFSTGAIVLQGQHEFVLDFLLRMSQPHQVVARVILPVSIVPGAIAALRENLGKYQTKFGPPMSLPTSNVRPPTINELYEQLKLPDDRLGGTYANGLIITHSASDFGFDFIANLYPRPVVACRVFLSAPQVPGLLATLNGSYQQFLQKRDTMPPPG